jgi:hypothetical protein
MNSTASTPTGSGLPPSYRINVYHPDTRALLTVPLQALTDRIERALKVQVDPRWLPTLVAMADGLFMQEEAVARAIACVAAIATVDPSRAVRQMPEVLEILTDHRIIERLTVEELYHAGRIDELSHPRVWELNGWWDKLYGVIPARSEWDDEEDLDIWEDGPVGVQVGKMSLPMGLEPEREEVRQLLEKRLLSQYEPLFRLRLSWHR